MARDFRRRRRCPASGKLRFATERQAVSYARQTERPWMHAYGCDVCGSWHLATPPDRKRDPIAVLAELERRRLGREAA